MPDEPFIPFGAESADTYLTLVDGVPPWLRQPLLYWIRAQVSDPMEPRLSLVSVCLDVELNTRVSFGVTASADTYVGTNSVLEELDKKEPIELLKITDYLIARRRGTYWTDAHRNLDRLLGEARSKWRIGERDGRLRLVERELVGLQATVGEVLSVEHQASELLARAWSRIHDLAPDFSGVYADAVRAVEAVSVGVVTPNKRDATLGDVGGVIASDPRWVVPLREHAKAPGHEVLSGMVRTLYSGHRDRHGSPDYSDVTGEEARAAVFLSATLVAWFASGSIQLSDTE